jgi:adenosylhomocysteinase
MCVGAVEQTTKGLRQDEEIKPEDFHFPLLDVAKSNFKDEYESPLVGRAAVSSIQRLLPDESLSGKIALVVGFGAIGREVALALSAIGMIVRVSDLDARKVAAARVRGFEAAISPMKFAGEAYIVIGTTGTQSVTSDMIDHMKNGTVIASTSSDQVEIDIEYLKQIAEERYEEGLGTHFSKKGERTECTLLLADGFPVNFFSGSGIPTKAIDPVLTQLFIGAIHLAKNHAKLQKGILTNKMDNLVDEYGLISDFLQTYVR